MKLFRRTKPTPSAEAAEALAHARQVRSRAEVIYAHRQVLIEQNHFADRIRLIYEGES